MTTWAYCSGKELLIFYLKSTLILNNIKIKFPTFKFIILLIEYSDLNYTLSPFDICVSKKESYNPYYLLVKRFTTAINFYHWGNQVKYWMIWQLTLMGKYLLTKVHKSSEFSSAVNKSIPFLFSSLQSLQRLEFVNNINASILKIIHWLVDERARVTRTPAFGCTEHGIKTYRVAQ